MGILSSKTTIAGLVAGLCKLADTFYPGLSVICEPLQALALALMGYFAADTKPE